MSTIQTGKGRILLIEDDVKFQAMMADFLQSKGHVISVAENGIGGVLKIRQEHPDLVILDLGLPDMDGLEVCAQIKTDPKTRSIPVLVLTGRTSTQSQLLALEYNADHYLAKPIESLDEFYMWVMALLRRQELHAGPEEIIRVGNFLIIDTASHTVTIADKIIEDMPPILFKLLCQFAMRPGKVLNRVYLVDRVWNNSVKDHEVDIAMKRLKKRLGPKCEDLFECVRGVGFRLVPSAFVKQK